ncbi:MAG: Arm DNA-binding domain-containing protein, partial [Devosia sp.]
MAGRTIHKLSDTAVRTDKSPGRYSDGGGLYLNVAAGGSKSWVFMWTPSGGGRTPSGSRLKKEMGLGAYPAITLAKARTKAADCRALVANAQDPMAERDRAPEKTFGECVTDFLHSMESEWRNEKHRWQWEQTLNVRGALLRDKRVSQISTEDVLLVLKPIWNEMPETASRLRGRIERVLNFAKVKGWRAGENPAAWRDNLRNLLPKRKKLSRGHHPAMPYADV